MDVVTRLLDAQSARDLPAILACFADDYRASAPCHPGRAFVGKEPLRAIWATILSRCHTMAVTCLRADVVRAGGGGGGGEEETVIVEVAYEGRDEEKGCVFDMRGVIYFEVAGGLIRAEKMYTEPVSKGKHSVAEAMEAMLGKK